MNVKTSIWILYIAEQGGYDAGFSMHMTKQEAVAALLDYAKAQGAAEDDAEVPTIGAEASEGEMAEALGWYEDNHGDPYFVDSVVLPEAIERRLAQQEAR